MASIECPTCGSVLANGVAVCDTCGKEVNDDASTPVPQATSHRRRNISGILAVFLAVVGGAILLIFTGLLPNPMKMGSTAAIVNGEKISLADVEQKVEVYQKMSGKNGQKDATTPEGKAAAAEERMQVLQMLIQEKVLLTEAAKEGISVTPQEIADKMDAMKKNFDSSNRDLDDLLKRHGMTLANFEKRIEKDLLVEKLVAKGIKDKGLTKEAWIAELHKRAKVEVFQ